MDLSSLREELSKRGINIEPDWSGSIQRDGPRWLASKKWTFKETEYAQVWYGDYSKDFRDIWKSYGELTGEEKKQAQNQAEATLAKEREERVKVQNEMAIEAQKEWDEFSSTTTDHAYLRRKNIAGLFGARVKVVEDASKNVLVVPLRDINGRLWNFQRIYSEKLSAGDKFFKSGALIDGCFHCLSDRVPNGIEATTPPPDTIYICEGFATACSIKLSLGESAFVVAAFNANNLPHVATALKGRFTTSKLVICADNDAYTSKSNGTPWNVGIEKGRRAAGATGADLVYPIFKRPAKGLTDFNDLHATEGLEIVKEQISSFHKFVHGIQPMNLPVSKNGKLQIPTEKELCDHILKYYGDRIVRQDKSLFIYRNTHWVELDAVGEDQLKQKIQIAANGQLGARDLENYFRYIRIHAPVVPANVNMFQPNPWKANFLNATVALEREAGKYKLIHTSHDPKDYLTSVLPFEAPNFKPGEELPPAPRFEEMLDNLWRENADKDTIKRFAYELLGGVMMPAFPNITYFYGDPGSGKSTFIKLLVGFVNDENVSNVQPCDMHGFNMESMIGKLLNQDTDVDTNKPFQDAVMKKLIDRMPTRVRRKGRTDAKGFLPAMHLFAGNKLPKTLDGKSGAYGRRMTIVHTNSFRGGDKVNLHLVDDVLAEEKLGIIARGLQGLQWLAENSGKYTQLESSKKLIEQFEKPSDIVEFFLDEIKTGEIRDTNNKMLLSGENTRIERKNLWECFKNWQESSFPYNEQIGKIKLFQTLEQKGFKAIPNDGLYHFKGIGLEVQNQTNSVV